MLDKFKKRRTVKKLKKNMEFAAICAAKNARSFENSGNQVLAEYWWDRYMNLHKSIQLANDLLA